MPPLEKEYGLQPLDKLISDINLKNEDLVKRSTQQLTFKQVRKARLGQRITPNIQFKILKALNGCLGEEKYKVAELFNY